MNPDSPIPDFAAGLVQRKKNPHRRAPGTAAPAPVVNSVPVCTPPSASVLTTSLLLSAVVAQICPLEDGWNHDATQARSSPARIHFAELSRESCTSESPLVFTRSTAPLRMDPDSCTPDSRQDQHSKARFRSLSPPFIIQRPRCLLGPGAAGTAVGMVHKPLSGAVLLLIATAAAVRRNGGPCRARSACIPVGWLGR